MRRPKLLGIVAAGSGIFTSLALGVLLAGCGSDGTSEVIPGQPLPQLEGKVTGVVWAPCPNGEGDPACGRYAMQQMLPAPTFGNFLASLLPLAQPVFAGGVIKAAPVGANILVSLSEVNEVDAADGVLEDLHPINQNNNTNAGGQFVIIDDAIDRIDSCRLMLSVGNAHFGDLSRAFIYRESSDVDAITEAVVRTVLNRLPLAPPVELCDFSREGLKLITDEAVKAGATARGTTVAEMNDDAYRHVVCDCDVQDAINAVTQTVPDGPRICGRACLLSEHPGR